MIVTMAIPWEKHIHMTICVNASKVVQEAFNHTRLKGYAIFIL